MARRNRPAHSKEPVVEYRSPAASDPAPLPAANQQRWLLLVGTILFLLSLLLFAKGNWAPVVFALFGDGILAPLWVVTAFGFGSLIPLPMREGPGEQEVGRASLRFATAAAMGLGLVSLLTLLAGWAGILNRVSAWGLIVIGLTLAGMRMNRAGRADSSLSINDRRNAWLRSPAGAHWMWLIVIPAAALAFAAANVPPGVLWSDDPVGYDVVEYHLQAPREWFEAGRIIPLPHNAFSYFPFNVEMHYLLAMQLRGGPWAGMYLAQIMHACFVGLTVIAVYGLAARLTRNRAASIVAAIAVAAVPWSVLLAPVGYNEGGLLLFGTLAVGWAIFGICESHRRIGSFAIAGALAGFACGTKLTAVPMILVAVAAVAALVGLVKPKDETASDGMIKRALVGPSIFVLTGLLTFSPWLIRNVIWTGNPIFPEAAAVAGKGYFSSLQTERWQRAHRPRVDPVHPELDQQSLRVRMIEEWRQVAIDWRYGYVLFPLAVVGLISGCCGRGWRDSLTVIVPSALLVMLAVFWVGFTHLQSRFFVFGIPLSALLIAHIRGRVWPVIGGACFACVALMGWVRASAEMKPGIIESMGLTDLKIFQDLLLPPEVSERLAGASRVTLIGDAKAFWYPIEMSRLRYRTVFDADTQTHPDLLTAWRGTSAPPIPGEVILVDPGELRRFSKTYWGIPALPREWERATAPFIIEGSGGSGALMKSSETLPRQPGG